jgi:hypothetical protein
VSLILPRRLREGLALPKRLRCNPAFPQHQRGLINPYIFATGGGGGVTVLWNPSDFNAAFTLSGGNLVAVRTGSDGWVSGRADHNFTAGKLYFEVLIGGSGSDAGLMVGLGDPAASLSNYCGSDNFGFGYNSNAGHKYHGGNDDGLYGAAYGGGDNIGIGWNAGSGTIFVRQNGVWQGGGDPVADTGYMYIVGAGTNFFPMISGYFGAGAHNFTLLATPSSIQYSLPTGFSTIGV